MITNLVWIINHTYFALATLFILAVLFILVGLLFRLARAIRELGFALIDVLRALDTAVLDSRQRRARLMLSSRYAQMYLSENRKALVAGRPMWDLAEMWRAGKFDVLIEETNETP